MNWQSLFGSSSTADWILLTSFHSLWLSLAAFLILHVRRFRAPTVRSTWCTFTLILLLALPMITWLVPRTHWPARPDRQVSVTMSTAVPDSKVPLANSLPGMKSPLPRSWMNQGRVLVNQFGLLWLVVALALLGRLLYQLAFLKGYCNGLQEVEDRRISSILQEMDRSFGFRKKPRFFISPGLTSPIATGMRTPLVILPANLYPDIGDGELRAILLHELAHIYHHDHVLGLLQGLVKALYWWNPFVYRLCNALSVAREEVSDNHAISGMESAASYAALLVGLIEKTSLISRVPCTAGMATPYESMETRIRNIVSKGRDMRVKTNRSMISATAIACILFCGLVAVGSQVKVFGPGQAPSFGEARPVLVEIENTGANVDMSLLQGSVFFLEKPDRAKYRSSPIIMSGDHGRCEFSESILPGQYKLILDVFAMRADVVIPPTPSRARTLHVNLAPGSISVFADGMLQNEYTDAPRTSPIRLDASDPPVILSQVELEYPPDARGVKISGSVNVEVTVNEKGEVYEARILSGHPWFRQPALNAVVQWKFQPLLVNGEPRPFITTVNMDYRY
jgi:TonB family protein